MKNFLKQIKTKRFLITECTHSYLVAADGRASRLVYHLIEIAVNVLKSQGRI